MSKKFSFDTIKNFDDHISGSIRGYILLDELICNLANFWAKDGERILDFGCTSGRLISKLAYAHPNTDCIGYDITPNNFLENSKATLLCQDITDPAFEIPQNNLSLCIFTMQFLTLHQRRAVLDRVYTALNPNGALIICEKEINSYGQIQEVFTFANYDYKRQNFNADEILEKEKDLRGIMNCLPDWGNYSLLNKAGFSVVSQFFQSLNFKGWICIK
jgi:tRNA (cmo5U34)-methyltransferase